MTEPADTKPPRTRGWIRILLGVSLALNLAVIGLAVGAALRLGGPGADRRPPPPVGALLYRELPREDRRLLRSHAIGDRDTRHARRQADALAVDAALRATPFDRAALQAVLDRQAQHRIDRQRSVQRAWLERVSRMSAEDRAAYADRLQEALRRHKQPKP